MVNSKIRGQLGEKIAKNWLKSKGFKIIDQNVKVGQIGEIDLICQKNGIYYFVEVKASFQKNQNFPPEFHFTRQKFSKVVKISNLIANRKNYPKWRVALLTVSIKSKSVKIRFYPNV